MQLRYMGFRVQNGFWKVDALEILKQTNMDVLMSTSSWVMDAMD